MLALSSMIGVKSISCIEEVWLCTTESRIMRVNFMHEDCFMHKIHFRMWRDACSFMQKILCKSIHGINLDSSLITHNRPNESSDG